MKLKAFFIIFIGLSLKQIKTTFLEGFEIWVLQILCCLSCKSTNFSGKTHVGVVVLVQNCSSSHVQVFRDRWSVQSGDGWNVQNSLINCEIWILQYLCCLSCNSTNFSGETHVNVVFLVVRVVFVWLVVWYVWFIKLGCIRCLCGMKENILNFALSLLCSVYMKFLMPSVLKLGCKRRIGWKQLVKIFLSSLKINYLRCFCCARSVSEFFFPLLWIENLGYLGCFEQMYVPIRMRYEFRKAHNRWKKLKEDWQLGRSMQTILSALLWFVKTMKGSKSGPEKHYYCLLPNNRIIQVGPQYSTTWGT